MKYFSSMRLLLAFLLIIICNSAYSQIRFPKNFKLIKGDNGIGSDDVYTDSKYSFDTYNFFNEGIDFEFKNNDDSTKKYLRGICGFTFHITKDSLYWGTGIYQPGFYSYIIVVDGEVLELYSKYNDAGFSYYSKWLLSAIRKDRSNAFFPMRDGN